MSYVALQSMEQAVPRAGLGNRSSSVDIGLVTVSAGTLEDCYSRKVFVYPPRTPIIY
jgi:hypothetical protein